MHTKALFLTFALLAASALAAETESPNADQLLRQMSAKLAPARSFSFTATREIDPALLEGHDLPEKARIAVAVQRPNKLAGQAKSKAGVRRFVFDGRTLSLLDEKPSHYAVVPMRTSLDGLVAALDAQYGFTPPLAEFALSDPYADLRQHAHTVTYLGRAKTSEGFLGLDGVECHRLALKGQVADAELWIAVSDFTSAKAGRDLPSRWSAASAHCLLQMEPRRACCGLHLHPAAWRAETRNVDHRENAGRPPTLNPT